MMEENTKMPELTYEQLSNAAHQLSQQNASLRQQMEQMNYFNLFKRLDYLFKVVEFAGQFPMDFVGTCTTEIQSLLTVDSTAENTVETKED